MMMFRQSGRALQEKIAKDKEAAAAKPAAPATTSSANAATKPTTTSSAHAKPAGAPTSAANAKLPPRFINPDVAAAATHAHGEDKPLSQRMFEKYDKDKSGSIDEKEFRELCYDTGHFLTDTEVKFAMQMADKRGTGTMDYKAFKDWWSQSHRFEALKIDPKDEAQYLRAIQYFKYFDKDLNGTIDKQEFVDLHADLVKNGLTKHSMEKDLEDLDVDGDGTVSFKEYIEWLQRPLMPEKN